MELRLSQLPGGASQRHRSHAIFRRRQRRRRALGAAERVARPPGPGGVASRALAARRARHADVCTDGELDHTLGLLLLREATTKLAVYAPPGVAGLLDREWPLFRILSAYAGLEPRTLPDGQAIALADAAGTQLGIACTAVPVARRPPRYARQAAAGTYDVGLRLTDERTGGTLAYVPAAGAVDDAVRSVAAGAGLNIVEK